MRLFTGSVISAALIFTAVAANAQGTAPRDAGRTGYVGASDFNGPYGDLPPERGDSAYGRGPAYGPDPAPGPAYGSRGPASAGAAYGPGPAYGPALLPPGEVYLLLRENGFRPLGPPHQRGAFYFIAVTDRHGEDGRLVIDARNGLIVRFVPTYRMGNNFYGGAPIPAPSAGRVPVSEFSEVPRPPAPVPKMASRSPAVPIPKAAPPRPLEDAPLAEKPTPQPSQQSAAVQVKPLDTPQPPHAAPPPAAEVKPAVPQIQPTQPMPQVQGLE
jgi:hypothetical protein